MGDQTGFDFYSILIRRNKMKGKKKKKGKAGKKNQPMY